MIKALISTAILAAVILFFSVAIPLGEKTLWEHLGAIASTEESQELVKGVKDTAREALEREPLPKKIELNKEDLDQLTKEEQAVLRKLIKTKLQREAGDAPVEKKEEAGDAEASEATPPKKI